MGVSNKNKIFLDRLFNVAWSYKLILSCVFALATGYAAQLRIPLPWTPVPITLQTFVVLLSGVLLGSCWGSIAQFLYVSVGVVGLPIFSGMQGGIWVILGPRGGYLIGFVLTAFFVGRIVEKGTRTFLSLFFSMLMVYIVFVYGLGCLQLGLWLSLVKGTSVSLYDLLMMGVIPFLVGDFIKIVVAAFLTKRRIA